MCVGDRTVVFCQFICAVMCFFGDGQNGRQVSKCFARKYQIWYKQGYATHKARSTQQDHTQPTTRGRPEDAEKLQH
jgi:hypothetical protein